ncbi:MAG: carboxylesterase family protein [Halieaceae bacterium]|nr:carboxylesterase family protein [Halieaceae bacterium]
MKKLLLLLVILLVAAFFLWPGWQETLRLQADNATLRDTTEGPVIGGQAANNTYAWLGIPYAASPEGERRWRAPAAPSARAETLQALQFGSPCVQLAGQLSGVEDEDDDGVVGSEDCLTLNIWSPREHSDADAEPLPVMLWIHGGGNTVGSAITYPGDVLAADAEVVLVTINYRLGMLGWLSHPVLREGRDPVDQSGNFGTLDIIAALQWVQQNIHQFGGDPERVTVFGESAGGRNVFSLMATPLAEGLFHRAIAQSGAPRTTPLWRAENPVEQRGHPLSSAEWLAQRLVHDGRASNREAALVLLDTMPTTELHDFLYHLSPAELLQGLEGGFGMYRAPQLFRDGVVLPENSLLEVFSDPERYNSVPLITGTNRDEMKLFMATSPEYVEQRFGILPRIRDPERYNAIAAYLSDSWKLLAVDRVAQTIASHAHQPVFTYRWDWDEGASSFLVDYATALGAGHGLEVGFVFGVYDQGITAPGLYNSENTPGRDQLAAQMRRYWGAFARDGRPAASPLPLWPRWRAGKPAVMLLDTEADGGLRLSQSALSAEELAGRLASDTLIDDPATRCRLYARMFLQGNNGDDVWDAEGYRALGCEQDPWTLL